MREELIYWSVYIVTSIFEAYTISKFMEMFLGKSRLPWYKLIIPYILRLIIGLIQHAVFPVVIVTTLTSFSMYWIIAVSYKGKFANRLEAVLAIFLTGFLAEAIVATVINLDDIGFDYNGRLGSATILIIVQILIRAIYEVINIFKNITKDIVIPRIYSVMSVAICMIIVFAEINLIAGKDVPMDVKVTTAFCLIVVFFMTIYLFDVISKNFQEKMRLELLEREKEYSYREIKLLTEQSEELRRFRHDIKNHLLGLEYRLNSSNEGAKEYIDNLNAIIDKKGQLCNTGNIVLDGLVNCKLTSLKDVDVVLDINIPEDGFIKDDDTVVLLGNLLDNAIEALEKVVENKRLELAIDYNCGILSVYVKNTYNGEVINKKGKIHTAKNDKINHGLGLMNVKEVVERYNGSIDMEYDKDNFWVDVTMYVE